MPKNIFKNELVHLSKKKLVKNFKYLSRSNSTSSSMFFLNSRNNKNNSSTESLILNKRNTSILPNKKKLLRNKSDIQISSKSKLSINGFYKKNSKIIDLKENKFSHKIKSNIQSARSRPISNISKSKIILGESSSQSESMNLMIKYTPQKLVKNFISQKITSLKNCSTNKIYDYKTNLNNIIQSPNIPSLNTNITNKIKLINNKNTQVFSDEEIIALFIEKCKDLDVPVKGELMNRFMNFIKEKCVNRIIDLSDCSLGINSMMVLSQILSKKNDFCSRVILTKNDFGDIGTQLLIDQIKDNAFIVELNLSSTNIGAKGGTIIFNYLINQSSIISLDLSSKEGIYRNRICSEGVRLIEFVLKKNFFLEKIDLSSNSLKNKGLEYIANGLKSNKTLKTLILANNEINENGICHMAKLCDCKLNHLDLSSNPISNSGLLLLGDYLSGEQLKEMLYLNVSNCSFNFEAFRPFIRKLSKNHRLQTLIANKNNLLSSKWDTLESLFTGMAIRNLSLGSCGLGQVMSSVATIFTRHPTIKYLDLSHNHINDKGFEKFQEYPLNNLSLEEIDFSNNFISDKSATIFFKNLVGNTNIQRLNFYDNQLQNESAYAILDVIKKNHNLVSIQLKCNRIGIKMMKDIKMQISNNKIIEKGKFVPKIKEEIKGLEFNPTEINYLKDRIIIMNRERESLSQKFTQDIKEYNMRKKKNAEEVKNIDYSFTQNEKEIKKCVNKLNRINEENNNENKKFIQNSAIIKEKISSLENEIIEIKQKHNILKNKQNEEKKVLKSTYDKTLEEEQQLIISISSLSKLLEKYRQTYREKMDHLEKLENLKIERDKKQKSASKKRSSSILKSSFTKEFLYKQKDNNYDESNNSNNGKKAKKNTPVKFKLKKDFDN